MIPSKKLILLTAPSGAGKSSIAKHLLQEIPLLDFSISATTRQPRPTELDGKDYYFIGLRNFLAHIEKNDFVEWEMVYEDTYYGTLKAELDRIWAANKIPILDIDVKGALKIQDLFPYQVLSIFIAPPNVETLAFRLKNRKTETAEMLQKRLAKAQEELSEKNKFTHIILNDNLEKAIDNTLTLVVNFIQ